MKMTDFRISDILTFSPIVACVLDKRDNKVVLDRRSTSDLSEKLGETLSDAVVVGLDNILMKKDHGISDPEQIRLMQRDAAIYHSKRYDLNNGRPVPVLVFGINTLYGKTRAYGIIVPEKAVPNGSWWYKGTKRTLKILFSRHKHMSPLFDSSDIKEIAFNRVYRNKIWSGMRFDTLRLSSSVKGNIVTLQAPSDIQFYFRYEQAVHRAYDMMIKDNMEVGAGGSSISKKIIPILVQPIEPLSGENVRNEQGIMRYCIRRGTVMKLRYAPLDPVAMGLYTQLSLYERAINFETGDIYRLESV